MIQTFHKNPNNNKKETQQLIVYVGREGKLSTYFPADNNLLWVLRITVNHLSSRKSYIFCSSKDFNIVFIFCLITKNVGHYFFLSCFIRIVTVGFLLLLCVIRYLSLNLLPETLRL